MKSILQNEKKCLVCGTTQGLHEHHVFSGIANRKKSEQHGMKVWLCVKHHTDEKSGVHFNKNLNLSIKRMAQRSFEKDHSRDEFIRTFGRNYIDD